ncbi:MAG TPA: TonB-dependent receptor [Candidatus Acidoferrales bacterium]|nr:TonB-dependent receptor [Candidatus Acidoferrales bacterium]
MFTFLTKRWEKVCLAVLLSLALAGLARAQSSFAGAITGTARDSSGAVVPGARVEVVNLATNSRGSATTDGNGRFVVDNLQPGTYTVTVDASGFATYKQENVIVEVGRSTPIDATLQVAAQAVTVVATAEAPVITTDRPDYSTNINTAYIANLPVNGRRWSTFVLGTPAAIPDGSFGLISFRGISGLLNNNTVDGGDNNQAFFSEEKGRTRISYSISEASIQEYQVNTSNFSAEYGRSAGAVVNAVTKSGGNQLHGEAFWYFRDSDFGAINPFTTAPVVVNGVTTKVPINPPDKRHQFGGSIGGPIVKNKLFFFFSGDQQLRNFPATASPANPGTFFAPFSGSELATLGSRGISASQANAGLAFLEGLTGTVPRKGDELVLFPKIDWTINPSNHFSVEYNRMRWNSPEGIQTGAVVFRGKESFGSDFVKDDALVARLTSAFTPAITNQALFEYGRDFEFEFGQPSLPGEPVAPSTGLSPQVAVASFADGMTFGMPNFLQRPAFPDERRDQFADTVSISRGNHLLKFGADVNRVDDLDQNLFQGFGAYSYNTRVDFISDYTAAVNHFAAPPCTSGASAVACYSSFNQDFGPLGFEFTTWDIGLFANDSWRMSPTVTVNLGMRYDRQRMPDPQIPNSLLPESNSFPDDRDGFGPRVGVAWDISGKGTTVIRGGYGIYYGRVINSTIFNAIANSGNPAGQLAFFFRPTTLTAPSYPNIAAVPPPGKLNPPDVVVFGPDTQNPMIQEVDAVFEHQLARNTALSVSYLGSFGRNLPTFIDVNFPPAGSTITYKVIGGSFDGQSFTIPLYTGTRPNPNFGRITNIFDTVKSHYNALVIQVNRRLTNGFQIEGLYSFSHAWDTGQTSTTFTASQNVFDPFNLGLEAGRSNFDVRHHFSALAVWQPEYFKGSGMLAHALLDGFSFAPILSISSGAPVTGNVGFGNAPSGLGTISTGINGAGEGSTSNRPPWIPRNAFEAPRTADVDLEIGKGFTIAERFNFKLFADAFNMFNHVNVTSVDTQIYTAGGTKAAPTLTFRPGFLAPTSSSSTLGAQRQIQIGAKLTW